MKTDAMATDLAERWVTLNDGRPGLRSGLRVQTRVPAAGPDDNPDRPVIDFVASDETLDRYDEILTPAGWKLDGYRRNPVFQNAHQYGDILFTLGKALVTEVRSASVAASQPAAFLYQRIEFATAANPVARIAYQLYRGGFLNAVSVGFIPQRWETGGPEAGFRRKYLEQELLEVSAVSIPANPNALQLGLKAGAVSTADLDEWLDLVRSLAPARLTPPVAQDALRWLLLARWLKDLLQGKSDPGAPLPD